MREVHFLRNFFTFLKGNILNPSTLKTKKRVGYVYIEESF